MQRTLEISRDNDAFHVVFDGVETLDQVEFIRSIGGTLAEGTLLSNAMNANEFLMRLETMGTSLPEAGPAITFHQSHLNEGGERRTRRG